MAKQLLWVIHLTLILTEQMLWTLLDHQYNDKHQHETSHHKAFDLCRSNECKVQRLPFLTFDAISSAVLDLQYACHIASQSSLLTEYWH